MRLVVVLPLDGGVLVSEGAGNFNPKIELRSSRSCIFILLKIYSNGVLKKVVIPKITFFKNNPYKKSNSLSMNDSSLFDIKYGNSTGTSLGQSKNLRHQRVICSQTSNPLYNWTQGLS